MGSQIVLQSDPLNNSYFILNSEFQKICFDVIEWNAHQKAIYDLAMQFGYIAFAAGLVLGLWWGYTLCRYRTNKEKL
jgi:hypothetical protein